MLLHHMRTWLRTKCPRSKYLPPVAFQHVFAEGDLLYMPSHWLHSIETDPAENGWWLSLNRFFEAPRGAVRAESKEWLSKPTLSGSPVDANLYFCPGGAHCGWWLGREIDGDNTEAFTHLLI